MQKDLIEVKRELKFESITMKFEFVLIKKCILFRKAKFPNQGQQELE